jgi:glycosyltransferase involved in cell wall biosynthesis
MNYPKISIVTPSFNQGKYLEETILSVINQNYPNLEYIIIDGGSTDNSVEIIKKYEKYLTYWVSEKDKGQSHAINKGLKKCTGEIFNWINSDDYLESGSLYIIGNAFRTKPNLRCFVGELNIVSGDKKIIDSKKTDFSTFDSCFITTRIKQPSTFYSTSVIRKLNGVNENLHYCMDLDLWYRYILNFGIENIEVSNAIISNFRIHENSKSNCYIKELMNDKASIFFQLLNIVGEKKITCFLMENFELRKNYQFENWNNTISASTIIKATLHFLLTEFSNIYIKEDFDLAIKIKLLLNKLNGVDIIPSDEMIKKKLYSETFANSWILFRIRRKFNHLISKIS